MKMKDIVERLLEAGQQGSDLVLYLEAAAEIKRLRDELTAEAVRTAQRP